MCEIITREEVINFIHLTIAVVYINKPGTAKVGATSRAQNCKRGGDPLVFVKLQSVAKFLKN